MRSIAFIIDSLEMGGAEKILISLANNLNNTEYNIHFIATRKKGSQVAKLNHNIRIHELNKISRWDFSAAKKLRAIIDYYKVEIVHSHSHSTSYFVTFAFLGRKRNFKHILHSHYGPIYSNKIVQIKDKLFLSSVNYVIASSELLYNYFTTKLRFPEMQCTLIHNGIINPISIPKVKKNTLEPYQILQTASINRNKNQLFSLKVCNELKRKDFNFKWIFAGNISRDHEYYIVLKDFVQRNNLGEYIEFRGEVSDIWPLISQSDLGVLTSFYESMPLAAIEYISGQLPCIFSPSGFLVNLAEKYNTCFLINEWDPGEWAAKIIEISKKTTELRELLQVNALNVCENYSLEKMIEKVNICYSKLT